MSDWKHGTTLKSYADARPLRTPGRGEYLFSTKCTACHTIGNGDSIGPDLAGVSAVRERTWLARYISTPEKLLADGDPIAKALLTRYQVRMPNLSLTEAEGAAIVEYVDQITAESRAATKGDPKSK